MASSKRIRSRARKARRSIDSGDDSSLSSNESDFLPNNDPIDKPSVLEMDKKLIPTRRLSTDTNSSSSFSDLYSNRGKPSPISSPNNVKQQAVESEQMAALRREIEASQQERKELRVARLKLASTERELSKVKKLAEESKRALLATPNRRPNSKTTTSSLVTPQRRTRQTPLKTPSNIMKTPGRTSSTPGKFTLDKFEESYRNDAKELKKKLDGMKLELVADSKQNHLKTQSAVNRNTNAEGAKTRRDLSAKLNEIQKENAANFEVIMSRLGHPHDIYVRDSTSTSTTAASTVSGGARAPLRARSTRKKAQPKRWN